MFKVQKQSNYGTATPAVARTFVQGASILEFFKATDDQKSKVKEILLELQRHLLKCVEIRDEVADAISNGHKEIKENGFVVQAAGRAVHLPSVVDLQSKAETFLQSAKLAIAQAGNLVEPFYSVQYGHKFHEHIKWAKKNFGESDALTVTFVTREPFVKCVVTMRNAVDHPSNLPKGRLEIKNFDVERVSNNLELIDPSWALSGECPTKILPEMDEMIEQIIQTGEEVLVALFYKWKSDFPLIIREIPRDQRDPANPRRLLIQLS